MTMSSGLLRLFAVAVVAAGLGACTADMASGPKHLRPVPAQTQQRMAELEMDKRAPILMRIFKAEARLEVWKQQRTTGQYALLRSFEICRWSGDLGPKIREGDRQAPEGFYTVTPAMMNPNSSFHLAFNTGFPNAFDRAHNRTGSHLMVHGDCSSRGCFAMNDAQVEEIFALARDAFDGGQRGFQLQIFPFEMTAQNLHRYRYNPNIAFWRQLKEGSDHFEVALREPRVQVCGRQYTFNREATDPDNADFVPTEACPPSEIAPAIRTALDQRRAADARIVAELQTRDAERRRASQMLASLIPGSTPDNATPVPAHHVFVTRQKVLSALPTAAPEALSLLPGAEAGPTPELRRIARGEIIGTPMIAGGHAVTPESLGTETARAPAAGGVPAARPTAVAAAPAPSAPAEPNALERLIPRIDLPAFLSFGSAPAVEPSAAAAAAARVPLPPERPAR